MYKIYVQHTFSVVWGLRPTLLLSRLPVLLVMPLQLFDGQLLLIGLIKVLIFEGLHVGAELAVRRQYKIFLRLWDVGVGRHLPTGFRVVDCPIHLPVELNVFEPRPCALAHDHLIFTGTVERLLIYLNEHSIS